ncbi:hypothetical protein [Micromonospora costi]|uniref:Uncharacterized protein n=1 Tax=Micromonospora costi TaxID=1530042 RepID=A0A3A9ZNX3_9ACTN|nr:hypothetical protein [Micromonospora costi]RKN49902.1 hypothetical protein D7193_31265 [Micromonospora costi]
MRRLLVATVLAAGLASTGGCGSGQPSDPPAAGGSRPGGTATTGAAPAGSAASGAGPSGAGPSGAASSGGGDTAAVCATTRQAGAAAVETYVAEVGRMVAAVGANDATAAETARRRAEAALTGWRGVLREQSARATDPRLRALLGDLEAEIEAMRADVAGVDETELDRLQQRLDQLCPG